MSAETLLAGTAQAAFGFLHGGIVSLTDECSVNMEICVSRKVKKGEMFII